LLGLLQLLGQIFYISVLKTEAFIIFFIFLSRKSDSY